MLSGCIMGRVGSSNLECDLLERGYFLCLATLCKYNIEPLEKLDQITEIKKIL